MAVKGSSTPVGRSSTTPATRATFKFDELKAAEAQLLGRITYQGFAAAWPTMEDTGEFGERMNGMPKYVVSSTLTDDQATWNNSEVIRDDVAGEVRKLKRQVAGDILVAGSAALVRSLAKDDLVDEYRLMVYPVSSAQVNASSARACHIPRCSWSAPRRSARTASSS